MIAAATNSFTAANPVPPQERDLNDSVSVVLVEDERRSPALCARIGAVERVALDTEFHNEKSYAARLMVVQLVVGDEVAIVDPLRVRDLRAASRALAAKTVVGHALQSDLKIFADRFGVLPGRRSTRSWRPRSAATAWRFRSPISSTTRRHSLAQVADRQRLEPRPLSAQQIDYLVDDVRHLFAHCKTR
jgi:5-enolpyruvylshikimate-3-phosphate synthase